MNAMRVLSGTQLAQGSEVDLFEKEFAKTFGFESWQIVSVNSGTSALELAYDLTELTDYDHVVTPVLTCTATNIPLVRRGVKISFADVRMDKTLNVDPEDVENKILNRTKALVFVHFGGSSKGLDLVEELADSRGLDLICDAAQALGSQLSHKARFSTVSLQAIKSLTSGDGGVLICRDREDAEKARKLRWYGYDRELKQKEGDCDLELAGYKYHMNDVTAAIARGNLASWNKIWSHRYEINRIYDRYGRDRGLCEGIWNPQVIMHNFKEAKEKCANAGFEIGQYHYRNDKYAIFRNAYSNCQNMDKLEDQYFMLPCHMGMSIDDADQLSRILWP